MTNPLRTIILIGFTIVFALTFREALKINVEAATKGAGAGIGLLAISAAWSPQVKERSDRT
jgi:hypothetical protein